METKRLCAITIGDYKQRIFLLTDDQIRVFRWIREEEWEDIDITVIDEGRPIEI